MWQQVWDCVSGFCIEIQKRTGKLRPSVATYTQVLLENHIASLVLLIFVIVQLKSLLWGLLARILDPHRLLLQGLAWEATQSHSSGASLQWGPHHGRIRFISLVMILSGWLFLKFDTGPHVARLTLNGGKWPWTPDLLYLQSSGLIGSHHHAWLEIKASLCAR